jgi:hypothetical protein
MSFIMLDKATSVNLMILSRVAVGLGQNLTKSKSFHNRCLFLKAEDSYVHNEVNPAGQLF